MNDPATRTAQELRQLLIEVSPLIEEHTARVCPACEEVCCRQRHGLFTPADRAYLDALGEPVPAHAADRPLDGPCQFLGPTGCAKPRWQRAWRCTWFFCSPLLQALEEGPQRKARALSAALERIARLSAGFEQPSPGERRPYGQAQSSKGALRVQLEGSTKMTGGPADICPVCRYPRQDCICCPE